MTQFVFLTETLTPEPRPYPYEILGLQPGDPLDDVLAVYAERSDAAPTEADASNTVGHMSNTAHGLYLLEVRD